MKTVLFRTLLAGMLALAASFAHAQSYPSKPIKIVVPYTPGGSNDIVARLLARRMGEDFGQPVIVENRPGAGGSIGAGAVAKSAADGYTILIGNPGPNAINPSLYANLAYDAENDFAPISMVVSIPMYLVVAASSPYSLLSDLLAAGRRNETLNFASAGSGQLTHLSGELLNGMAGTKFAHIPYNGGAQAVQAVLSGDVSFFVAASIDVMPLIKQGKLRALCVMSARRSPAAPDVPTSAEGGAPLEVNLWYGLLAPAKTPGPIVESINREVVKILGEPDFQARIVALGAVPAPNSPEEFAALIKSDIAKYAKVVKAAGIKLQ